jgi:hypothetical protein
MRLCIAPFVSLCVPKLYPSVQKHLSQILLPKKPQGYIAFTIHAMPTMTPKRLAKQQRCQKEQIDTSSM